MFKSYLKGFSSDQQGIPKSKGVRNDGMKYEIQVITLLAVQLAQDQDIDDYRIISSPKLVNGFDDIVAIIKPRNNDKYALMLQVKQSTKVMRLITHSSTEKGKRPAYLDIPLYKYLKTYNELIKRSLSNKELQKELVDIPPENYYFGIFTTMGRDIVLEYEKENFINIELMPLDTEMSILKYISTNKCYSVVSNDYLKDYVPLFNKLCFLVEQHNSENMYELLQAKSPTFTNNMVDNLCNTIDRFMNSSEDTCLPLTKARFFETYLEVRLSQTLCVHTNMERSFKLMETDTFQMWRSIFKRYNITIFHEKDIKSCQNALYAFYERQIRYEYNAPEFTWHGCIENCFRLNEATIRQLNKCNIAVTHLNDLLMYMWKDNKIPLIIDDKTKDSFKSVLKILSKVDHQYILLVNGNDNIHIPDNIKTFQSAYDLINESYFNDIMQLEVSLQGRVSVFLKDVVGKSADILRSITAPNVLKWTYNSNPSILIGNKIKETDRLYITRQFYVSGKTVSEQRIVENLQPGLTAISSGPGMGKSTVIGSLALNCKAADYVLMYNLADCVNDLQLNSSKIHSDPIDYFFEKIEQYPNKLTTEIYKHYKTKKKLILLIDSFDEILPIFTDNVIQILQKMLEMPVLITTRTQAEPVLRYHFKRIKIIELKELEQKDVDIYIQCQGISKEVCEDMPSDSLTTPLHLVMYCSVYKRIGAVNIMPSTIYEEFIQEKMFIYFNKVNINDQNNQYRMEPEKIRNVHMKAALVYIFGEDILKNRQLLTKEKWNKIINQFNNYKLALGILSFIEIQNGFAQIRFVHKTFAEYFVARLLFEGISEKVPQEALKGIFDSVMKNSDYIQIKKFLCQLKTGGIDLETFDIEDIEAKNFKFLCTVDEWNLLPLQWFVMNMYHANVKPKNTDLELFEKILFYSAILIEEKDIALLGRCFNGNNTFYRNITTIAEEFGRDYIINLIELLRTFNTDLNRVDDLWFSSYVNILSKFTASNAVLLIDDNQSQLPTSILYIACMFENTKMVEFILKSQKVSLNVQNKSGDSTLHIACSRGNLNIVKLLLDQKIDSNIVNRKKQTSLHVACLNEHIDIIELLLENYANPYLADEEGKTCFEVSSRNVLNSLLRFACKGGDFVMVRLLLKYKVDLNATNGEGLTSLHLACQQGHRKIIGLLFLNGADPFLVDRSGRNCFDTSPIKDNESFLSILLHDACNRQNLNHVRFLLKYKADPNALNKDGYSPLHLACRLGNINILNALLDNDANPKLLTKAGENCLHVACCENNVAVVKLLLEYDINPNQPTLDGSTCLHLACQHGNMEVVETLLDHKANPYQLNDYKENSLCVASKKGNAKVANLILEHKLYENW